MIDQKFWAGKRVFLTGHTGFKGSWLSLWLQKMGANVKGFALLPPTEPSMFKELNISEGMESEIADIRDNERLLRSMELFKPEIVIHMAAQPLVRLSYTQPIETYHTNVMGTVHLLNAVKTVAGVKAVVNVTSDKCYENKEWPWGYREDEPKGGFDPYSNSKGCAELVADAFRNSYFNNLNYEQHGCAVASVRAGNVIGGGDWACDRLIPDMLSAFEKHEAVNIRNPHAIRPWQHVLEPLSGYLLVAQLLYQQGPTFAEGWNFGPRDDDAKSVKWIAKRLVELWGEGASWQIDGDNHPHEAGYLKLDCSKAKLKMNWEPRWGLEEALERIVKWHKARLDGKDMKSFSLSEIEDYIASDK